MSQKSPTVAAIKAAPGSRGFQVPRRDGLEERRAQPDADPGSHGADSEDTSRGAPFVLGGHEPRCCSGPMPDRTRWRWCWPGLPRGRVRLQRRRTRDPDRGNLRLEDDLHGFRHRTRSGRGYRNIRVACRLRSDATREQLLALSEHVQRTAGARYHPARSRHHRRPDAGRAAAAPALGNAHDPVTRRRDVPAGRLADKADEGVVHPERPTLREPNGSTTPVRGAARCRAVRFRRVGRSG